MLLYCCAHPVHFQIATLFRCTPARQPSLGLATPRRHASHDAVARGAAGGRTTDVEEVATTATATSRWSLRRWRAAPTGCAKAEAAAASCSTRCWACSAIKCTPATATAKHKRSRRRRLGGPASHGSTLVLDTRAEATTGRAAAASTHRHGK